MFKRFLCFAALLLLPAIAPIAAWGQAPAPVRTPATVQCSATQTVTASSAYANRQLVGGLITCSSAVRAAGLGGIVQSAWVTDKAGNTGQSFELWPFTAPPMTGTVTMTIASPGVVTWTGHNLANGAKVVLTTTGALPTGLVAGTTYFVVSRASNTFQLAATSGGSAINTSGSQSGVHTVNAAIDGSPIALNAADLALSAGPPIALAGTIVGGGSTAIGVTGQAGLGQAIKAATASTTLYFLLVTGSTPTFGSTADVATGLLLLPD